MSSITQDFGDPFGVSSVNATGIGDVLDEVYKSFPEETTNDDEEGTIKVAIIGKPNARKIFIDK